MLASKAKMCTDGRDYDDFAYFLAYDVFDKIERPRNFETPIKSVLNYIKSIIYWRNLQFKDKTRQQIYDPLYNKRWGDGTLKNNIIDKLESANKDLTEKDIKWIINSLPKNTYNFIPKELKSDKVVLKYIYISVNLSLIRIFSTANNKSVHSDNNNVVLYKLDSSYENIVKVIINKILLNFADNIKDTIDKFKIGDFEYEILMNSVFGEVNRNEEY